MNRLIALVVLVFGAVTMAPSQVTVVHAQPSAADMTAAKKAYGEGKALFDKGKFDEAVEKFLESYRKSKNPALLYNIGISYQSAKQDDLAILYYKRYLKEAPAEAAQRPDAEKALADLGAGATTTNPPTGTGTNPPTGTGTPPPTHKDPVAIKPAGTYSATDFQHVVVMDAPPGKPLDVTASVPEDAGWTVTLYFRGAGDTKFFQKTMKWRYRELVARIPAQKMGGQSIQYYVEAKDQAGAVVTRSGKSTSPNLVTIDQAATVRFYPDFTDDDAGTAAAIPTKTNPGGDGEEDPLHPKKIVVANETPFVNPDPNGQVDTVGAPESNKMKYLRLGTTIGAAAFVGLGVAMYFSAGKYADSLASDVTNCKAGEVQPCHKYDDYDQGLEDTGKSRQLLSNVAFGVGAVTAVVAGYLWYKHMKAPRSVGSRPATDSSPTPAAPPKTEPSHDEFGFLLSPAVGDGYAGATALIRF